MSVQMRELEKVVITEKDREEIRKLSKRASDGLFGEADARAQYELAETYQYGNRIERNFDLAVKWYRKAAKQGHAAAQYKLGVAYYCGRASSWFGDRRQQTVEWYRKAAAQGYAPAQCELGNAFADGYGVEKDLKQAFEWYQKATSGGDLQGQLKLGEAYEKGQGIPQDLNRAAFWYRGGAARGYTQAKEALARIEPLLPTSALSKPPL